MLIHIFTASLPSLTSSSSALSMLAQVPEKTQSAIKKARQARLRAHKLKMKGDITVDDGVEVPVVLANCGPKSHPMESPPRSGALTGDVDVHSLWALPASGYKPNFHTVEAWRSDATMHVAGAVMPDMRPVALTGDMVPLLDGAQGVLTLAFAA